MEASKGGGIGLIIAGIVTALVAFAAFYGGACNFEVFNTNKNAAFLIAFVSVIGFSAGLAAVIAGIFKRKAERAWDAAVAVAGYSAAGVMLLWGFGANFTGPGVPPRTDFLVWLPYAFALIGAVVLLVKPSAARPSGIPPETVLAALGVAIAALPWRGLEHLIPNPWSLMVGSAWQSSEGAAFSFVYFVLGILLLITGGRKSQTILRASLMLLTGIIALVLLRHFATHPPPFNTIGGYGYTDNLTNTIYPSMIYQSNFMVAVITAFLTTLVGAIQLRNHLAAGSDADIPVLTSDEPRLSKCALIGVIWAPFTTMGWWSWQMCVRQYFDNPAQFATYDPFFRTLGVGTFIVAATAGLGSTLLGGIAIAQIKRSGGKLYGLPLAAAALLFQPLVALALFTAYALKPHALSFLFRGASHYSPNEIADLRAKLGDALSFSPFDLVVVLAGCGFAGWFAWRKIAGGQEPSAAAAATADSFTNAKPLDHRAAVGPVAPRRRHALYAVLTLLVLGGFFFGAAFHAKSGGGTTLLMIGALDPLFIRESGPSGFSTSLNFFSWSFLAWVVGGGAFSALLRVLREDEGKVPRDPGWWRDWWKQVGLWGGLLLAVCVVRTVMNPRAVLQPPANRQFAARAAKETSRASKIAPSREFSIAQDHSQLPTARTPGRQDYAFTFAAPTNHTLNVRLEVWRDGKLEIVDSFDFWARPKLGAPLAAALRLTTMDGEVASVESAGKVRFDWTMNCGGTNGTGITAGAWRTNIFKNCFSLNSTWDYPTKDGWHPRPGGTVTVLALCGYRPDNLSTYDQTWDETSLLKGWPTEAILLRARYNPARAGDLANGPGLGNNVSDRSNLTKTFAQFTIGKVIGADLSHTANPSNTHKLLVAAVATPENQQAAKKMVFARGAGGAWQNTASPEEIITKLEQAIDDVTSKKRIVQAEPGGPLMIGTNGPELHADAIKKLRLSKLQADEINRVMQSHHRDYLALERRHSKITKDAQGRLVTTIAPFTDECQVLAKRLVAELGGIVEFAILPQPRVGQLPTQIFRWGGELPQTITMWQADGKYFVEDKSGTFTFNMSGPDLQDLPVQYRLFWRAE